MSSLMTSSGAGKSWPELSPFMTTFDISGYDSKERYVAPAVKAHPTKKLLTT